MLQEHLQRCPRMNAICTRLWGDVWLRAYLPEPMTAMLMNGSYHKIEMLADYRAALTLVEERRAAPHLQYHLMCSDRAPQGRGPPRFPASLRISGLSHYARGESPPAISQLHASIAWRRDTRRLATQNFFGNRDSRRSRRVPLHEATAGA